MIKVVFLGTAGGYDSKIGNTVSTLISTNNFDIILDAGNGLLKLDEYTDCTKDTFLFISHLHLDHIIGIHSISKFNFKKGLNILLADNHKSLFADVICPPYSINIDHLSYPVKLYELPKETGKIPFKIHVLPMKHSVYTLGISIEIDNKKITYCTDTGVCENMLELADASDLLITECSHRVGENNPGWPHLNPEEAAKLALDAHAKKLALTHFDSNRYSNALKNKALKAAKNVFMKTIAAKDNMVMDV